MRQRRLPVVFMRGGTSKALVFHERDLPAGDRLRDAIFLAAMGSPDPTLRQLDGMGGGVSSLSKVCIIAPSSRADADIDYTFAQIGVRDADVDYTANCGNMSSAMGPFAVEEGLVTPEGGAATVRIYNTNTRKLITSSFAVADGVPVVEGDFVNPGVAGQGAPIRLDFHDPGGAATGRLLPTGRPADVFEHADLPGPVRVSMVDATNPCVFVSAADLGATGHESAAAIDADAGLMERLELVRRLACVAMGLAPDLAAAAGVRALPKVALVAPARDYRLASGDAVPAGGYDVAVRMISMGQAHRAIPLTGAMCTAVAAEIAGSTVHDARAGAQRRADGSFLIGHSSGLRPVAADVASEGNGWAARSVTVFATARRLMEGNILVPAATGL